MLVGHSYVFFGESSSGEPLVSCLVVGTLSCKRQRARHHGSITIRIKFQKKQSGSNMEDWLWEKGLERKGDHLGDPCRDPTKDSRKSQELSS